MDEAMKTALVSETQESASQQVQPLKAEEEQALRYVAGYIPMKLRKKVRKAAKQCTCSQLHGMPEYNE